MRRFLSNVVASSRADPARLVWVLSMFKAGLWLATCLVSALLVYWLHFKPAYEEDWTASIGSLMCAGLAIGAAIGFLNNLGEAYSAIGKPHRHLR